MGYTSDRFLILSYSQLSFNQSMCSDQSMCSVKQKRYHCFQFAVVLNLRVVGVPEQQLDSRLQAANIAQYFYFRNALSAVQMTM